METKGLLNRADRSKLQAGWALNPNQKFLFVVQVSLSTKPGKRLRNAGSIANLSQDKLYQWAVKAAPSNVKVVTHAVDYSQHVTT